MKKNKVNSSKKENGVFYSSNEIARFICEKCISDWLVEHSSLEDLQQIKILDNACGEGVFLVESFYILRNIYKEKYPFIENVEKYIIENNLYGVDIEENSINYVRNMLIKISGQERDLETNIKLGNSLISDKNISSIAFDWEKEFPFRFDVIVGNPPYVSIKMIEEKYVKYFFQHYKTAENRINLYALFIEKSLSLLKEKGILSFVIPNSLLVNSSYLKIRELLYNGINRIVKLPDNVFEAAKVETIIFSYQNNRFFDKVKGFVFGREEKLEKINLKESDYNEFDKINWNGKNIIFNIYASNEIQAILKKCYLNSSLLEEFTDISLGITPYDKYKGHSSDIIENRKFHSEKKIDTTYQPLISGSNILPYYISSQISEYIRYGDWLGSAREERFFTEPRIIVRQIISGKPARIYAGYTDKALYFTQIGFSVISKNEINILYLLTIINSKLINFIHKYKFLDVEKEVFQKILIENFRKFPIKLISEKGQQPFINAAQKMLELQKQFHEGKNQFLELLAINFDLAKATKKLENWYELEKKDFLAALEKQKVTIPLKKQAEFFTFFVEEKGKIATLQQEINALDNQINAMVYKLYGLNELEIKQIEEE